MSAAAGTYRDVGCKDSSGVAYCQNLKISVSFGVVVAALALIMMVAVRLFKEKQKLKLIVEGVTSWIVVILYAVAVAYTTSPNAPGAVIGNLYYFTWFSFIITVMLLLDCSSEFRSGGEAPSAEAAAKAEEEVQQAPPETAKAEEQA